MKKLTQADRADIIRRLHAGDRQKDIADDFKVAQSTINRIRSQAKKAEREVMSDPYPARSTEMLQKRYASKYNRLTEVIAKRNAFLNRDRDYIKQDIEECEAQAKKASTPAMAESYQRRADTYRLELTALDDLSDFDSEITDLSKDLYTLTQVLFKIRKTGLGREVIAGSLTRGGI